ncbi:hypothetical protein B0T10DRAFT_594094 [Thelonectria olida]|uniref:Apple domain-containing protein n=1 Tax=Thelonectria olida TaxID=1576542 RepID=A0A9P8W881_9HYPO|nr:hypothetical protein B0T10DRAFT_594094 [Thelonectria olida]
MFSSTHVAIWATSIAAVIAQYVGPAPLTCFPHTATPDVLCSKNGFVSQKFMDSAYIGPEASEADCKGRCSVTPSCTAFAYSEKRGDCYVGTQPWPVADFEPDDGEGSMSWSQRECYDCYDNAVLNLGFQDGDEAVDDWTLDGDLDLGWFLDRPAVPWNTDRGLRIGEPETPAAATATYLTSFPLRPIPYKFGYKLRITRNEEAEQPFDAVTFYISTGDEVIFEFTPKASGAEFIEGKELLEVLPGNEGDATLSIVVSGTGKGLDYYFDYLWVSWGV